MSVFSEFEVAAHRQPDHQVNSLFVSRWSPRAMSGEKVSSSELNALFEAARWAPSCYNAQPWRFIYAQRDTAHWEKFNNLLVEFNQSWCANAAALVVVTSAKQFEWGEDNPTHSYDTGAAWQNLSLQAVEMGLVVHGMAGFDYEKARADLNIPDDQKVEAMFAVGYPAPLASLPEDLQKEESPSDRKPITEFIFEGAYSPSMAE
jgi:nitroreductase